MNYQTNEGGEVKVHDEKGNVRFLPKHLAEDEWLLKRQGLTVVPGIERHEASPKKEAK